MNNIDFNTIKEAVDKLKALEPNKSKSKFNSINTLHLKIIKSNILPLDTIIVSDTMFDILMNDQ